MEEKDRLNLFDHQEIDFVKLFFVVALKERHLRGKVRKNKLCESFFVVHGKEKEEKKERRKRSYESL